jgi:uncharacterized protein
MRSPIKKKILRELRQITGEVLKNASVDVYLFGSWALGKETRISDIDIAVEPKGSLPRTLLSDLRERVEESRCPYRVDIVDLSTVGEKFKAKVKREGVRWNV